MAVKEHWKLYIIFGGKVRSEIHLLTTEDRGGFRHLGQKRSKLRHLWKSPPFLAVTYSFLLDSFS